MSSSISSQQPVFQFPRSQTVERNTIDRRRYDALAAELPGRWRGKMCGERRSAIYCGGTSCWPRNTSTGLPTACS